MMALAESRDRPHASRTTRRRGNAISWIWIGLAVSLPLHALLLVILSRIDSGIGLGDGDGIGGSSVTIALNDPTEFEPTDEDSSSGDATTPAIASGERSGSADDSQNIGLPEARGNDGSDASAVAAGEAGVFSVAGGGGGEGGFGSGAGSGTTFFGVAGRGKRIGYVVDKSGSMGSAGRIHVALEELRNSVAALPDFASVCIALFDDGFATVDPESGFVKCHPSDLAKLRTWLANIAPGGGTNPVPAFAFLFSRRDRPDAVFFMSDGEIPPDAADEILRLNRRGPNTVIHCIAYGQAAASAPLRRIAAETGGTFSITRGATP